MPVCPLCPKPYQSQNDLDRHLKKIHGVNKSMDIAEIEKLGRASKILGQTRAILYNKENHEGADQ